jgi:uncharacterized membrane protein
MIKQGMKWLAHHAWERVNITSAWREFKALGKKYGKRFFIAAVIWEFVFEDGLFPLICIWKHHPELAVLCLFIHFEPVVYPCIIWGFKMWDRFRGKEPWEPDRSAMSTYWRTTLKVFNYRALAALTYWAVIGITSTDMWVFTAYVAVMFCFAYVHERIWHDMNWGITPADEVMQRRTIAKSLTYRTVSFGVMAMMMRALMGSVPWSMLLYYQAIMLVTYYLLERVWAKSMVGIRDNREWCNVCSVNYRYGCEHHRTPTNVYA